MCVNTLSVTFLIHLLEKSVNFKFYLNSPVAKLYGNIAGAQACYDGGLTLQCLQTLARLDVPDLDCGVCVAWDQDVVFKLHATGEGLMPR